jgi:type IV secretion system protein VirB10
MVGAPDTAHPTPAALPAEVPLTEPAGAPGNWNAYAGSAGPGPSGAYQGQSLPPAKTPAELARERRLAGGVFARESGSGSALAPPPGAAGASGVARPAHEDVPGARQAPEAGDDALAVRLRPTATAAVQAQLLPTARFLLPKGAFIDCTLETAIDSTLPGMTTCVTAADTFGADGKVVLLERGSKLVGETRGQVQQGQARVFVVWTEVRTPTGVIVPLDSPGTDELGRAGLPGEVQRHFWERFGAAMLVSVVNGAVQAGVQAANHSGGAILYAPSTSQDVLTEALKDSVHIAPTVIKRNGDRIQVLVARDLDFRSVYELRTSAIGR